MANIGPFSPCIVELLLQYGADPNSGGRLIRGSMVTPNESDEDDDDSSSEEEEGAELGEEMGGEKVREEDTANERLMAGKNEGSSKVNPLHMLCSVHIDKAEDKEQVGVNEQLALCNSQCCCVCVCVAVSARANSDQHAGKVWC